MMVHFLSSDLQTNITDTDCGRSKLCVSSEPDCNPEGNSSCFFVSTQSSNAVLTVELSGTTSGYVALGLNRTSTSFPLVKLLTRTHFIG